ncbi:hypothetical protein [Parabacteroides sp. PF5-9]|uniref:hypothetical protein n=1 Tax=Parabacteroides sp. PF5-9 TaxID=1742404 RepID=UPI0024762DFC|nr:hypothetical protein [Parabacteroides sp. PF5-9]MDH6359037.1 hypothetical protein [Parabacteroides sp. PF5-9]
MTDNQEQVKKKSGWKKIRNSILFILLLGLVLFVGIRYYYPYGEGVKSGQLNFVVYKGIVFKTYEGKLIQSGFKSSQVGGIQSNEFTFSIADKEIAEKLMLSGGKMVDLHYKEYFGVLPWRGYSRYVVDAIVNISEDEPQTNPIEELPPPPVTEM